METEMVEKSILQDLQFSSSNAVSEKDIQALVTKLTETRAEHLLSSLTHELSQQERKMRVRVDSLAVRAEHSSSSKHAQEHRTPTSSRESDRKSKT